MIDVQYLFCHGTFAYNFNTYEEKNSGLLKFFGMQQLRLIKIKFYLFGDFLKRDSDNKKSTTTK